MILAFLLFYIAMGAVWAAGMFASAAVPAKDDPFAKVVMVLICLLFWPIVTYVVLFPAESDS